MHSVIKRLVYGIINLLFITASDALTFQRTAFAIQGTAAVLLFLITFSVGIRLFVQQFDTSLALVAITFTVVSNTICILKSVHCNYCN